MADGRPIYQLLVGWRVRNVNLGEFREVGCGRGGAWPGMIVRVWSYRLPVPVLRLFWDLQRRTPKLRPLPLLHRAPGLPLPLVLQVLMQ